MRCRPCPCRYRLSNPKSKCWRLLNETTRLFDSVDFRCCPGLPCPGTAAGQSTDNNQPARSVASIQGDPNSGGSSNGEQGFFAERSQSTAWPTAPIEGSDQRARIQGDSRGIGRADGGGKLCRCSFSSSRASCEGALFRHREYDTRTSSRSRQDAAARRTESNPRGGASARLAD